MANDFTLGVGQAHELEMAMNRVGGWDGALVKALSTGSKLADVRDVLLGRSEIKPVKHTIDCDADPFLPEGWKVESHKKNGKLEWDSEKIQLYLSAGQKDGKSIEGNELQKELASKPVLNANVLAYLLAHPELIPEEWKGRVIFFWGTIYRFSDGSMCVRCLCWSDGWWGWDGRWLGSDFYDSNPAVLSASI
jgi:hypothetical protein